jgi:hypothetical protein
MKLVIDGRSLQWFELSGNVVLTEVIRRGLKSSDANLFQGLVHFSASVVVRGVRYYQIYPCNAARSAALQGFI